MVLSGAASLLFLLGCFCGCVAAQYDGCTNGTVTEIGDGRCNAENNNPSCGFDGGDVRFCLTLQNDSLLLPNGAREVQETFRSRSGARNPMGRTAAGTSSPMDVIPFA